MSYIALLYFVYKILFNPNFRLIADGYDETIIDSSGFTATELAIILEKEWLLPYLDGSIYHDEEVCI